VSDTISPEVVRCWRAQRRVIGDFLRELRPDLDLYPDALDQRVSALLARLAAHDPPLLIGFLSDFKE
jgi:hypothetical protein